MPVKAGSGKGRRWYRLDLIIRESIEVRGVNFFDTNIISESETSKSFHVKCAAIGFRKVHGTFKVFAMTFPVLAAVQVLACCSRRRALI